MVALELFKMCKLIFFASWSLYNELISLVFFKVFQNVYVFSCCEVTHK
jgi:hypothetical protein